LTARRDLHKQLLHFTSYQLYRSSPVFYQPCCTERLKKPYNSQRRATCHQELSWKLSGSFVFSAFSVFSTFSICSRFSIFSIFWDYKYIADVHPSVLSTKATLLSQRLRVSLLSKSVTLSIWVQLSVGTELLTGTSM
jgi:hypothetical protein